MKRRNFILLSATGVVAIAVPSVVLQSCSVKYDSSLALPQQLSYIMDVETLKALGNEYQKQFPKEYGEQKLAKLLIKDNPGKSESPFNMEEKIIEDFEMDRTVLLDGWILSVTEARQCALFSITQSN